jgi:hypothetical protein
MIKVFFNYVCCILLLCFISAQFDVAEALYKQTKSILWFVSGFLFTPLIITAAYQAHKSSENMIKKIVMEEKENE